VHVLKAHGMIQQRAHGADLLASFAAKGIEVEHVRNS